MNATERRLFGDLLGALAERFSGTGHVLQQIEWENRGHCPPGICSLRCSAYRALLIEASELLERQMRDADSPNLAAEGTF